MYLFRQKRGYQPIPIHRETPGSYGGANSTNKTCRLLVLPAIAILSCVLGFVIGTTASATACSRGSSAFLQPTKLDIVIPTITTTFKYNRTFSEDPWNNSATEEAWESIVPGMCSLMSSNTCSRESTGTDGGLVGQGSVRYPAAMPQVYTLSVVHQLHCLVRSTEPVSLSCPDSRGSMIRYRTTPERLHPLRIGLATFASQVN